MWLIKKFLNHKTTYRYFWNCWNVLQPKMCASVWIPEQTKLVLCFLKLLCNDVDIGGVLGREAPQNTSYSNFKTHKGSKSEEKVSGIKPGAHIFGCNTFNNFKSKLFCDSKTFIISHKSYNSQAFTVLTTRNSKMCIISVEYKFARKWDIELNRGA